MVNRYIYQNLAQQNLSIRNFFDTIMPLFSIIYLPHKIHLLGREGESPPSASRYFRTSRIASSTNPSMILYPSSVG